VKTGKEKKTSALKGALIVLTIFIGFVLFLGVSIWMVYFADKPTFEAEQAAGREEKLKARVAQDDYFLNNYGWVNEAQGVVRIPIDQAIQLTIEDLKKSEVKPASFVDPEKALAEAAAQRAKAEDGQTNG